MSAFTSMKIVVIYTYVTLHFILLNLELACKINLTHSIPFNILELEIHFFLAKKTINNVDIFNNV